MMFSLAKDLMESTRLWRIVQRMPKGSLLHGHLDAMVDFGYVFGVLLATPGIHVAAPEPLSTPAARAETILKFRFRTETASDGAGDIWGDDYVPGTFVLLTAAADRFPDGGREGFVRWLRSRCTISQTDSVEQHHGVDEVWQKFIKCFRMVGSIIHYEPIFRAFLQRLMGSLHDDGINWIEMRCVTICSRALHAKNGWTTRPYMPLFLDSGNCPLTW